MFVPEAGAVPFPGYKLVRLRGRGGFATVWEAIDPAGERVAMKFMSSANLSTTARELRSLQAIQTVTHPNLLRTRQVWSLPGCIVIAMDLAEASMLDLLELYVEEFGKPIEPERLGAYLYQVALALDFLNTRRHKIDGKIVGLQHGDIKPNNILLIGDLALLADYGLATPTSGPLVPCPRHGTAEYCAPEVFQGHVSERSDQFSLAVTYHVLRTGTFPYPPPPSNRDHLRNYVRPDPDLANLTPAERPVLLRALSPIPQNRYPSCLDLMTALLGVMNLRAEKWEDGRIKVVPANEHTPGPGGGSKLYKLPGDK
jgi:serine/threonine protein kinase